MGGALLFDLDGTLIDSDPLHTAVFAEMLGPRGIAVDAAFYRANIQGRLNEDIFAELWPEGDAAALSDAKEAIFRERLGNRAEPTPGVAAVLDAARAAGWSTAVVTNAPRANAEFMLAAIGLADRFDTLVVSGDCAAGKPHPAPYLEGARRLGVAPAAAVAFEDSRTGIAAARAAGTFVVGIRSSLDAATLTAAGAALTIADFTDPALSPILARLKGAAA